MLMSENYSHLLCLYITIEYAICIEDIYKKVR